MTAATASRYASQNNAKGRGYGLAFIFILLERSRIFLVSIPFLLAGLFTAVVNGGWLCFILSLVATPILLFALPLTILILKSRAHDDGPADWDEMIQWRDQEETDKWKGRKIPMEILYEAYMHEKLDFKQDVYEVLLQRNKLFRFCFTRGDINFYLKEMVGKNTGHSVKADEGDIAHVYDRGNDFYNWFLGETMVYTCGIFRDEEETVEVGQRRKLDTVCKNVHMKEGDKHLDIGCGWGTLLAHAAKNYGTHSTGITLSKEQKEWALETAEKEGVSDRVEIIVDDYRKLPDTKYDKITCLEMAEHVGIKNFQKFLLQVRHMLEDDGVFYLQIAGLRRPWQFEDLVWGMFMTKYIFPHADASCPLGFVVGQCERAGFEVHRVENTGVHYSLTIYKWYENWKRNEKEIVEKYGEYWFRMWMIFLAWSAIIAAQGSSTLFMVTLTKNHKNDKRSVSAEEADDVPFSRMDHFVGPDPIATQQ